MKHCIVALAVLNLLATTALAQDSQTITQDGVITGTMEINFKSRTEKDTTGKLKTGSAALGAKDTYAFTLAVAETTEFTGRITRQPQLLSGTLLREMQPAELKFDVDLAVRNPKDKSQRRSVGKWVGTVPINTDTGVYSLGGGVTQSSPLRIQVNAIGRQPAFEDRFRGRLVGKAAKKEGLSAYTYKRLIGDKTVSFVVKRSDPMKFEAIELAKGPSSNYPHTTVNGRLDYDYETGNWLTDGVRFNYSYDGKDVQDVMTGSIKWVEDENRATTGKGYYDFNLRFNEEKAGPAASESAAFDELSDEDAFFAVDDTIPCITGKITYEDQFISGSDTDDPTPASSKVKFELNANKLTKVQVVNFFKLWMLCSGPTNDE